MNTPNLSPQEIDSLRLIRSENVGSITYHKLIEKYKTPTEALKALPSLALKGGKSKKITIASQKDVLAEFEELKSHGGRFVFYNTPAYPKSLANIYYPPPVLSCIGQIDYLNRPCFGIVGSRHPSIYSEKLTAIFAKFLGEHGYIIVSGLAKGIDTQAHRAALKTGTIAVLGSGLKHIYPKENKELFELCKGQGLLVSEYAFHSPPQAHFFPKRNHIIAGLSIGILVTEAAQGSGSLITADLAFSENRYVFALPGSPAENRHHGTNTLIKKQIAILVETPEEILNELSQPFKRQLNEPNEKIKYKELVHGEDPSDTERMTIYNAITTIPLFVDELVVHSQLSAFKVNHILLELELAGKIIRHPDTSVIRNIWFE